MDLVSQNLLMTSGGKKSTYVDDVFATYLYKGTGSPQTITNGIDLAGEGGMTWIKSRNWTRSHNIYDTVRGVNKVIYAESSNGEVTKGPANQDSGIYQFNNNGFNIGAINGVGASGYDYSSWTFRKAPGFFDVVTYTGNGSSQNISHSLGCVPGMIMVKNTSASNDHWAVYHRNIHVDAWNDPKAYRLRLDEPSARSADLQAWGNTDPTSTQFTVGSSDETNENGSTIVAYLFAGGESTAATARSVDFDGSGDYLSLAASSDLQLDGDFTVEFWVYPQYSNTGIRQTILANNGNFTNETSTCIQVNHSSYVGKVALWDYDTNSGVPVVSSSNKIELGQWSHVAVVRSSGTITIYINGVEDGTATNTNTMNFGTGATWIGQINVSSENFQGHLSNLRVVKGTAVYTSSFRPTVEPLTNITNTKLLCCNNSSTTGSTVTPGTITANGNPTTASTESPFDDPKGFKFGEGGDQNLIKTGSYVGNGSSTGPEISLGWEPQWLMFKASDRAAEWSILDCMRGIVTGGNDAVLYPSELDAEVASSDIIEVRATGFRLKTSNQLWNQDTKNYIFCAIRRPDGLVGKPAEVGTNVFAMDTGAGSSTIPNFDSGFPVDFALDKKPASGGNWDAAARLMSEEYLQVNSTAAEVGYNKYTFDSNTGWNEDSGLGSIFQSWMWKRHAGLDVVMYKGNQTSGHDIAHNLGRAPEMIWTKNRDQVQQWSVGHKGLNGGTNPWNWVLVLSDAEAEQESAGFWEAPTATHFTVGSDARVNKNNLNYLAILFSSVEGISKVGSYTGSSSALTITTGFQPRFVIFKNVVDTGYNWTTGWFTFDTTRGWAAGNNDKRMRLNDNAAQTTEDWTDPTSTGFTINANSGNHLNHNGERYIYYAHA